MRPVYHANKGRDAEHGEFVLLMPIGQYVLHA